MCGIAGFLGEHEISEQNLSVCLEKMSKRGPDSAGKRHFYLEKSRKHLHLLHSRLKIIDLENRANQPFQRKNDFIVFNGEIYNYLENRAILEKKGEVFITHSDTEVLIASMQQNAANQLDGLEGMWAFAFFEASTEKLVLSRDRFGEKPLYIYKNDKGIYFASEIKFLAALIGKPFKVNKDHVCRYLVNGYKSLYKKPEQFFVGVSELPAGTIGVVDGSGNFTIKKYWTPVYRQELDMSEAEAIEGARTHVLKSMELRLRADVPLAFCMSGGIDSNALICTAKKFFGYDVHGFTVVNTDERYEEMDLVRRVVDFYGLKHTPIHLKSTDFLTRLRELVRYHDAPVFTITYYTQWLLMEEVARAGYKISLSGTGADELFSGYFDHHLAYLYEVRNLGDFFYHSVEKWRENIGKYVRNPFLQNPNYFIDNPSARDHIFLNAKEFSTLLKKPWAEPFREETFCSDLLRNRMLNEMFHEAVPVILHEDDLNAMYFSIENRSPFLDRRLFEFCQKIPTKYLVKNGRAKSVLREAMRGVVPDEVLNNPKKIGFNAPIHDLLNVNDSHVSEFLLNDSPIFDLVDRDGMRNEIIERKNLKNSESKFLFNFLNAKLFLEENV